MNMDVFFSRDTDEISEKFKRQAYTLCIKHLSSWNNVPYESFKIEIVKGGLTNLLFKCYLSPICNGVIALNPASILLRIHGVGTEKFFSRFLAEMSFVILSERKVGPKLLGIFTEGHIEEFFEAKTLQPQDLCLSKISFKIAKSLARFHAIDMPLERTPSVFNTLRSWYSSARLVLENGSEYYRENRLTLVEYEKELQQLDLMKEIDFKQEVEFLVEKILSLAETPVKFCHNDVNAGNVLCLEDGSLQLIDFEYSAYNHVGFEFANHFCERIFDYSGIQEYPFFRVMLENFPDLAEQRTFLEAYLSDVPSDAEPDVRVYLAETNRFVLVCHMLWALWSIIQFDCSTIVFPYLKYASIRLDMYFQAKEQLDSLLARI